MNFLQFLECRFGILEQIYWDDIPPFARWTRAIQEEEALKVFKRLNKKLEDAGFEIVLRRKVR